MNYILLKNSFNLFLKIKNFLNAEVKYFKLESLERQNFSFQILIWLWEVLVSTHCF